MAIEIRELVVRATVTKSLNSSNQPKYVSEAELKKFEDRLIDKVMSRVKDLIEEDRSWR